MKGRQVLVALCLLCLLGSLEARTQRPSAEQSVSDLPGYKSASHVLVIGISGLGSAYFNDTSKHPTLDGLIANGTSSFTARAALPTQSKPNWATVLSSGGPEETGVDSDDWYHEGHCENYRVTDTRCLECLACSTVVPIVQDLFKNDPSFRNESEAVIEQALHDACDTLKFPLKATCNTAVSLFAEEIIEYLMYNLTATEICQTVRLCRNQLEPLNGAGQLFPTMFKAAKYSNPQFETACFTDDDVIVNLLEKRLIDHFGYYEGNSGGLVTELGQIVLASQPEVSFIHFGNVESAALSDGFGSQRYLQALAVVDQEINTLLNYYRSAGVYESTLVMVVGDHGGSSNGTVGQGDSVSAEIPWIVSGPGVKTGYTLKSYVRGVDIPATAMHALGVERPLLWIGHPVLEAWTGQQRPTAPLPSPPLTTTMVVLDVSGLLPSTVESSMPNLHAAAANGASTNVARAVMPTNTLANVASILMGAGPEETGVCANGIGQPCTWAPPPANASLPPITGAGELFPSVFDVLYNAEGNYTTGFFVNNADIFAVVNTNHITKRYMNSSQDGVTNAAIAFLQQRPSFAFIQFDQISQAGEEDGYNSTSYLAAAAETDKYVGKIIEVLQRYLPNEYILVIQSDHGGVKSQSGETNNQSVLVPWVAIGQGVRYAFEILEYVRVMDTAALCLWALGVPQPPAWIGMPPLTIFYNS